jgi:tetratricopeptide (TPR) repeat protein
VKAMVNKKQIRSLALYICTMLAINVILISSISATQYSFYNGTYFSVEYPVTGQIEENNTSLNFSDENTGHYVTIETGEYYPTIAILNNYSAFVNGSLDEMTMHFLETLKIKSQVTSPGTGIKENTNETQVKSPYQEENATIWNDRGVDLYAQGKYDEALKCYDKAIEFDPQFSLAWNNKDAALFALNQSMQMHGIKKASLSRCSRPRVVPIHHSFQDLPYIAMG